MNHTRCLRAVLESDELELKNATMLIQIKGRTTKKWPAVTLIIAMVPHRL